MDVGMPAGSHVGPPCLDLEPGSALLSLPGVMARWVPLTSPKYTALLPSPHHDVILFSGEEESRSELSMQI